MEKYNIVCDLMEKKEVNGKIIPIYKETTENEAIRKEVFNGVHMELVDDHGVTFTQSYDIMYDAIALIADNTETVEDLADFYPTEYTDDIASIYYSEQLEYLNTGNMHDIAEIIKEHDCEDVATACAVWYEREVKDTAESIKE